MPGPLKTTDVELKERRRTATLYLRTATIRVLLGLKHDAVMRSKLTVDIIVAATAECLALNTALSPVHRLYQDELRELQKSALTIAWARRHDHHQQAEALERCAINQIQAHFRRVLSSQGLKVQATQPAVLRPVG